MTEEEPPEPTGPGGPGGPCLPCGPSGPAGPAGPLTYISVLMGADTLTMVPTPVGIPTLVGRGGAAGAV